MSEIQTGPTFLVQMGGVPFVHLQDVAEQRDLTIGWEDIYQDHVLALRQRLLESRFGSNISAPTSCLGLSGIVREQDATGIAVSLMVEPLFMTVTMPRERQDLPADYEGAIIEEFQVGFDGRSYIMVAEEPEGLGRFTSRLLFYEDHIADRFATLLAECLRGSPGYSSVVQEPSPFPLAVHVRTEMAPRLPRPIWRVDSSDRHSAFLTVSAPRFISARDMLGLIAAHMVAMSRFFDVLQTKKHYELTADEFMTLLDELHKQYIAYSSLSRVRIFERSRQIGESRKKIAEALNRYAFLNSIELLLGTRAEFALHAMDDSPMAGPLKSIAAPFLQLQRLWKAEDLLRSLRFYEEESRTSYTVEAAFGSALVAALVSAVVAGLIKFL